MIIHIHTHTINTHTIHAHTCDTHIPYTYTTNTRAYTGETWTWNKINTDTYSSTINTKHFKDRFQVHNTETQSRSYTQILYKHH